MPDRVKYLLSVSCNMHRARKVIINISINLIMHLKERKDLIVPKPVFPLPEATEASLTNFP